MGEWVSVYISVISVVCVDVEDPVECKLTVVVA